MADARDTVIADFDRQRGIFTSRDRRFLADELNDELDANEIRQKRYRLRQRMVHAIQDLSYLKRMDTRDLGQVIQEMQDDVGYLDETGEWQGPTDPESGRKTRRILDAIEEMMAFFREFQGTENFRWMVEEELTTAAALDYYEQTGAYGRFEVSINIERKDEFDIDELVEDLSEERSRELRGFTTEYPGLWDVLDFHFEDQHPLDVLHTPPDPENPELVRVVLDTLDELTSDGEPADRNRTERVVAEEAAITRSEAKDAIEDTLTSGLCYPPKEGKLRRVPVND